MSRRGSEGWDATSLIADARVVGASAPIPDERRRARTRVTPADADGAWEGVTVRPLEGAMDRRVCLVERTLPRLGIRERR
jgi:hypothetical protein